jgi:hypothetical protein
MYHIRTGQIDAWDSAKNQFVSMADYRQSAAAAGSALRRAS